VIELESLDDFDAFVASHTSLRDVALQGLDLTERSATLQGLDVEASFFLGCELAPEALASVTAGGACVFPRFADLPVRPFRSSLYTAEELYEGYTPGMPDSYGTTIDSRAYHWHRSVVESQKVVETLAERVHDHAIDNALTAVLQRVGPGKVVAIMGGHSMRRDDDAYARVAMLAKHLADAGFYMATGGGPGAMEAANLGAFLRDHPDAAVDEALAILRVAPTYEPMGAWLDTAFEVRDRFPRPNDDAVSLGVPTWHYGHEPPNLFATEIAKYFSNSIREDGLLAIALAGVVFAPGSAGTIQEIFQDAAQNHYKSFGIASPMVFMDVEFWTAQKPVYPLLKQLADGREYGDLLSAFDDFDDIVAFIEAFASS